MIGSGRRRGLAVAPVLVVAWGVVTAGAASAVAGSGTPRASAIDAGTVSRYVADYRNVTGLPGAVVVITQGDHVVTAGGYGSDSRGDALTSRSPLPAASLSKSFTATAVLQLVEAGKVTLDHPVVEYLPEFAPADARAPRITVRELLNQTSGMSDTGFAAMHVGRQPSLRAAVALLRTAHLTADPGTRFQYHNPNYWVAARLVEVVAGQPYGDYLRTHVLDPAGMTDTFAAADPSGFTGVADGYVDAGLTQLSLPEPQWPLYGAADVVTTAADLGRWLIAQTTGRTTAGRPLLSAASLRELHTASDPSGRHALGWTLSAPGAEPATIGHDGTLFTFSASQTLLPGSGYGIAVLADRGLGLTSALGVAPHDAAAIREALVALQADQNSGFTPSRARFWTDLALASALVAVLGGAVRALRGTRRWATRRGAGPWWRVGLGLLPWLLPAVLLGVLPWIAVALTGRDVTFLELAYISPVLVVGLAVTGLLGLTVIAVRVVRCAQDPRLRHRVRGADS